MKTSNVVLSLVLAAAFVLGMAGMASAAVISCGGCHGDTAKTPAYESHGLPTDSDNCAGDARGLHGVHGNYSSASYAMSAYGSRGSCSYCHTSANGGHPSATHNNNYINITGSVGSGRQNWDTTGLDYDDAGGTCTNSCHKNNSMTAQWGNYTSPSISLSCQSCHDDSSDTTGLSGAHTAHMTTNISTISKLPGGGNGACDACHPDNTSDLWSGGKADDGTVKAYPHASDGTNVNSDNASLDAGISATRSNGDNADTCANACHNNATTDQWGASQLTCNSCHYNTAGTIMGGSHTPHVITQGFPCSYCHSVPSAGDTTHVTSLPPVADNATVLADPGPNAGASWTDGTNTCSNTGAGCHNSSDVVWGATLYCNDCHNYPNLNNWTSAGNGHTVQYGSPVVNTHLGAATDYNALTDTYAAVTADASKCGKCHSGGTHKNLSVDVAGNGNNYCGTGDFTVTVNTTGSDVTCSNVSCHSGKATPNWW